MVVQRSRLAVALVSIAFRVRLQPTVLRELKLSGSKTLAPDGWARGEREGYGEPCDVTSPSPSDELTRGPEKGTAGTKHA